MGTKQGPEPDFVTWGDVIEHLRYYEQGYGVHINTSLFQTCPKGEQHPRLGVKLRVQDEKGEDVATVEPKTAAFPNRRWRTLPALLLHMLWELDQAMAIVMVWAEPLAERPRKAH